MRIAVDMDRLVPIMVQMLLPQDSGSKKVLPIMFRVIAIRTSDKQKKFERLAMFVFQRPGNRTKVLWRAESDGSKRPEDFKEWDVVSNDAPAWIYKGVGDSFDKLRKEIIEAVERPEDYEIIVDFMFQEPKVVETKGCVYDEIRHKLTITW